MWTTPDLSEITLIILGLLNEAVAASHLANASLIKVSPSSPKTLRHSTEQCHLTLYLLHIGRDPYWRNTPLSGPRPQLNNRQPRRARERVSRQRKRRRTQRRSRDILSRRLAFAA